MPFMMASWLAGSRACDGTDALPDVRRRDRVAGAVVGGEGSGAAGAAAGGVRAAPPAPAAEAGLGRPGGAGCSDAAASPVLAGRPAGDAGHAAALAPADGPLA